MSPPRTKGFFRSLLRVGDGVRRGEVIGLNGCTGRTRYPHVHFSVHRNANFGNKRLNPHGLWHVDNGSLKAKVVKVPFFEEGKFYEHDDRLTAPIRFEDCNKKWTTPHPTKPWRCH